MTRKEYEKQWRKNNPAKIAGYTKKWNAANPEKRKAVVADWRARNPENVARMNKLAGAKWSKANPGLVRARVARRRAAKLQRTPPWANQEQIKAIYKEAVRLTKETGIPHEVDHIYPLQGKFVSGLHVETNLQILTRSKNRSKGIKYADNRGV